MKLIDVCIIYGEDESIILYLYVDDILIFEINIDAINEVKSFLSKNFDMKDLGEARGQVFSIKKF
jgi:hypothetical protein